MRESGFTLLEVLIALAILSGVALVAVRAAGDGLAKMGDSGWNDLAARMGRAKMLRLAREGIRGNTQGSFAPDFPEMRWSAVVVPMGDLPGRKLEFLVTQEPGGHKLLLEKIIVP